MKAKSSLLIFLLACILIFPGCLTCDIVTFVFTMTTGKSGTLKISYQNIGSTECSEEDFVHFFDTIVNGNGINNAWPEATNVRKKFYEEKGNLNADITMDFTSLEAAGLYRYDDSGPYMFMFWTAPFIGVNGKYIESNGTYGGDKMPVVFWNSEQKTLTLKVQVPDTLPSPGETTEPNCLLVKFRERQ